MKVLFYYLSPISFILFYHRWNDYFKKSAILSLEINDVKILMFHLQPHNLFLFENEPILA